MPESGVNWEDLAGEAVATVTVLGGGRNSRVVRIQTREGTTRVGKEYFRHPADPRDRLATELVALQLMAAGGVTSVPRILSVHEAAGVLLLEDLAGDAVEHPTPDEVRQLTDWLLALQRLRPQAAALSPASEACFCAAELAANLERRLQRLLGIPVTDPTVARLHRFLREDFAAALETALDICRGELSRAGIGWGQLLPTVERILSPSDCGFHNARRQSGGRLAFCDFEYFGWDDPAKTICDLVLHRHPLMQLDSALQQLLVRRLLAGLAEPERLKVRCAAYYRLFRLMWVTIMLNEFLPVDGGRRRFAAAGRETTGDSLSDRLSTAQTFCRDTERDYERFRAFLA